MIPRAPVGGIASVSVGLVNPVPCAKEVNRENFLVPKAVDGLRRDADSSYKARLRRWTLKSNQPEKKGSSWLGLGASLETARATVAFALGEHGRFLVAPTVLGSLAVSIRNFVARRKSQRQGRPTDHSVPEFLGLSAIRPRTFPPPRPISLRTLVADLRTPEVVLLGLNLDAHP